MNTEYYNIKGKDVKYLLDASYKRNKEILYEKKPSRFDRFELDKKLSDSNAKIFTDKYNHNKPVVVFTGTRKLGDIFTDTALALGLEELTPRFRESHKLLNEVKKKYNSNAIVLGHSLGSDIARHTAKKDDKIISYNPGTGLGDLLFNPVRENETLIRGTTDLVSALNTVTPSNVLSSGTRVTIPSYNPLTSHNLSELEKIKNKTIL